MLRLDTDTQPLRHRRVFQPSWLVPGRERPFLRPETHSDLSIDRAVDRGILIEMFIVLERLRRPLGRPRRRKLKVSCVREQLSSTVT